MQTPQRRRRPRTWCCGARTRSWCVTHTGEGGGSRWERPLVAEVLHMQVMECQCLEDTVETCEAVEQEVRAVFCHGAAVVQHVCVWWVQHAKYEFTLLTRLRGLEDELARERTRCAELAAALHKAAGATARFRALAQAGFCGGLRARALAVGSDVCRGARVSGRGWRHWRLRRPRRWTPRGTAQSSRTRWMRVSARFCPDCVW